ncbi:HAD family phosphatase [Brooklawnia cerclae]|uniref:HAD superfamily hydrolase (TIGR01509 family) n=1 Tax=Brooklawnia cerclae TaxID=349934 RepID=A0ABX0SDV9_9ACTN|nr:HAD family phosphatase [Brooklawnia cerclae]NIH56569.1 HAD superfamily hydrolase (TIGR01509 family) [Brooklawnia cerclae]
MATPNRLIANRPSAVLWDYDGTLIDTEPAWIQAEIDIMAARGARWTYEQGTEYCGTPWDVSSAALIAAARDQGRDLEMTEWEVYEAMASRVAAYIADNDLPWLPGARELLEGLASRGTPMAIVSASPIGVLQAGISRMPTGAFGAVVTGQEVTKGKPDPEGYLTAATRLGVLASECVVVEDSAFGTQAGRAAGAVVIAVPIMTELADTAGMIVLPSLAGVGPAELDGLFTGAREVVCD